MPAMQFFVMDELTGQQTGPYSLMQIQEQISSRQLKKKDFVRRADSTQWGKASVILGQVFENIENQRKAEKQNRRDQKASQRKKEAQTKADEKTPRAIPMAPQSAASETSAPAIQLKQNTTRNTANRGPKAARPGRFLYRVANLSGWALMLIGLAIFLVAFYILFQMFVIGPLTSVAEGAFKESRKGAALQEIAKKMPQVPRLTDEEKDEIRWDMNHPLYYYVRFYDDWVDQQARSKAPSKVEISDDPSPGLADQTLFRDAGFLPDPEGLRLDSGQVQTVTAAIQGSMLNLFLVGVAIPVFLIAIGSSIAAWSGNQLATTTT